MASLIENLITVLNEENSEYETLLALSMEKTNAIVSGDVNALNELVEKEQGIVERINKLEKKRTEATGDVAIVLNKKPEELTLGTLAELLAGRSAESGALKSIHDRLKSTLGKMVQVNDSNRMLLQESIDMVDFELNLAQSLRQSPATANYSGSTYTNDSYGPTGSFDAKQ